MILHTSQKLLELLIIATLLGLISRLLLARWILAGLLSPTGSFFRVLWQIIRTPGNIVHEFSHAVGYLVAGFRILDLRLWFNDPAGNGYVQAGAPYAIWGRPALARILAPPAPFLGGALALRLCANYLNVPVPVTTAIRLSDALPFINWQIDPAIRAVESWSQTPYGYWQMAAFVGLALSLGVELAPSTTDVKAMGWMLVVAVLTVGGGEFLVRTQAIRWEFFWTVDQWVGDMLQWLTGPLVWAAAVLLLIALVLAPLRILVRVFAPLISAR